MNPLWILTMSFAMITATYAEIGSQIVDNLLRNYKKSEPPSDNPTLVNIGIYINSMSFESNEMSVTMYFRQSWIDPRLKFESSKLKTIRLSDDAADKIWIPDTFFRNEISANFHDITVKNRLAKIINATGGMWYVTKLSAVFRCPMKLQQFPFDVQHCKIMVESFGYTMEVLYLGWLPTPIDVDADLQISHFYMVDTSLRDCSQNYTSGNFTCLEATIVLRRHSGYYIDQYFRPTILLVILSWLSFLMSAQESTPRVLIGLVTILATALIKAKARDGYVKVSYCTSMDVWMCACMFFVLMALVEFIVVNLMSKRSSGEGQEGESKIPKWIPNAVRGKNDTSTLDKISLVVFPAAFTLFNIFYWIAYAAMRD